MVSVSVARRSGRSVLLLGATLPGSGCLTTSDRLDLWFSEAEEQDLDGDGIGASADCNDQDASVGARADDQDCDLVPTDADCDDTDPSLGDAAVDQPVDALAAMLNRKPDSILVAEAAPGVEGVADVILKRVVVIQHGGNAALGPECCAAADIGLADDGDLQVLGQIQGNSEAGSTAADNQDIEFVGLWHRVVIAGHNVDVY